MSRDTSSARRWVAFALAVALGSGGPVGCASAPPSKPEPITEGTSIELLSDLRIVLLDGTTYHFVAAYVKDGSLVGKTGAGARVVVPLEKIDTAWRATPRRSGGGAELLLAPLALLGGLTLSVAIVSALTSCPFVYLHDGTAYRRVAEPLGGAVTPGLSRTDHVVLGPATSVDGRYRIKLVNELRENQYVDHVALAVVDHDEGSRIVADVEGRLHTVRAPVPPQSALVNGERSVLDLVRARDGVSWSSDLRSKTRETAPRLRDELVVTFPRPAGVNRARLLLEVGSSPWAVVMFKRYLALVPDEEWTRIAGAPAGSTAVDALRWAIRRQGLLHMEAAVWDGLQWGAPRYVAGGGPLVPQETALDLDVSPVRGNELRVRLSGAAGLWLVDAVALDSGTEEPIEPAPLPIALARSDQDEELRDVLAQRDGRYLVLDEVGSSATVELDAPTAEAQGSRTLLLEISGYYDVPRDSLPAVEGPSLASFLTDADAAGRYSLQVYHEALRQAASRSAGDLR